MVLATSGPRRVPHDASIAANKNMGHAERWLSVLGGSALAVLAANRRGASGVAMALVGAELIRRGATGHCLVYDALGVTTASDGTAQGPHRVGPGSPAATVHASRSVKLERSVTVNRPAAELYEFWKDPRNLPRFMELVESVEPIDDRHARWTAGERMGKPLTWVAEIINDIPNELIAWKSEPNADVANAGSVHFRPAAGGRGTEVKLVVDYEPRGGQAGHLLAKLFGREPDTVMREDLRRFKRLMETGGAPTVDGQSRG